MSASPPPRYGRRFLVRALLAVAALAFLLVAASQFRSPRLDRDWDEDVAVLADVSIASDGTHFTIRNARAWRYASAGPITRDTFTATYRFADLSGMAFYEQPLDRSGLIAHTFVVFEFAGDYAEPLLGVSVETRRERGEKYSLLKGALRGFELTYTWATATDLVERRVKYLGYRLRQYPVRQAVADQRRYLERFLRDTIALASEPRWYNTITSNCTNVIIAAANDVAPGFVPFDISFVLTGLAPRYLAERGILDGDKVVPVTAENFASVVARR